MNDKPRVEPSDDYKLEFPDWVKDFDPSQPRDPEGQWSEVGGSAGNKPGGKPSAGRKPGRKPDAGSKDKPIRVHGDLDKAAKLLAQGKPVELDQPREASTLLDKLGALVKDAEAKGDKAPTYDLCKVTVPGTNLFCSESKGIPRIKMPQLKGKPKKGSPADKLKRDEADEVNLGPAFRKHLESKGVKFQDVDERADYLRATQRQLNGAQVAGMLKARRKGNTFGNAPLLVSRDNYIVDGHHRWATAVAYDLEDNKPGDIKMPVERANIGIGSLLFEALHFAEEQGLPTVGVTERGGSGKGCGCEPSLDLKLEFPDWPDWFHADEPPVTADH